MFNQFVEYFFPGPGRCKVSRGVCQQCIAYLCGRRRKVVLSRKR
ncbi:Uncharacterised protein [Serratia proteamaculans]|nr:Uncharacterised protein [Serratia proteamaculans]